MAEKKNGPKLTVQITGLTSNDGIVLIQLKDKNEKVISCPAFKAGDSISFLYSKLRSIRVKISGKLIPVFPKFNDTLLPLPSKSNNEGFL